MSKKFSFMFGNDLVQNPTEAQLAMLVAFDRLLNEMTNYFKRDEAAGSYFETDEGQAGLSNLDRRVNETMARDGGQSRLPDRNPEEEKQRARDENMATLGGQQRRLEEVKALREVFSKVNPESMSRDTVAVGYALFKDQLMRVALVNDRSGVSIYAGAVHACSCISESWDEDELYPFVDSQSD